MASQDPLGNPFPALKNDCILRAARGQATDFVPVWIMRQAGRYLPEFRELRRNHSFFRICETPELACEVTLMPLERFNLDAAIIFSDILVIPQALGMDVQMTAEGPKFPQPLKLKEPSLTDLTLDVDISERLSYVYHAITTTRLALSGKCPLIGFSGAPWTLMCYMIEGGGSKTMSNAKKWLYQNPKTSHDLLETLAIKVSDHLVEQVRAGAQMLQIFESNAEYLTPELFKDFAYPYIVKIARNVKDRIRSLGFDHVPLVVFAKGGHYAVDLLSQNGGDIDVLGLDWTMSAKNIRRSTTMCLQGNLDPCAMYTCPSDLVKMIDNMVERFGTQNYIANLGHGIYPDAKIECVKTFVDHVHHATGSR